MPLTLDATTAEHIGDRAEQQDRVAIIPSKRARGAAMVILADGAGGYTGGAAAAQQVIATATNLFEGFSPKTDSAQALLAEIASETHTVIKLNRTLTEEEPHSTFVAMILQPERADWGHVGDSRLYHFRHAALVSRTPDHSLVEQMIREGSLKESERKSFPQKNMLLQALGGPETPEPSFGGTSPLRPGDTFMLCSDGLWDYFDNAELGKVLSTLAPRKAAETLIAAARVRARGRGDNCTLALVKLTEVTAKV
ncbi:MAG: protein phosphatase 2C domain-containing protein [Burkholderiales bacterium]|nr:protein phosphatase 2C domain-containing protein [Burkholderiales bacterium]